jgi:hypothetical protein
MPKQQVIWFGAGNKALQRLQLKPMPLQLWQHLSLHVMILTVIPNWNRVKIYKTGAANCITFDPELKSEPYSDDVHIKDDLTIHVPSDMIQDDHALALVQVVPPDADLSDIPETWDVYNIDLAEKPSDKSEWSGSDRYWEEDPPDEIYDEPNTDSDSPDEGNYDPETVADPSGEG